jgi:hypothetical protein
MIELTRFAKIGGPLTKRIALSADGALMKDGSACIMSNGRAQRARFDRLDDVAELIQSLGSHEAISLGSLRPDLPDQVEVTTQDKLTEMNGLAPAGLIARNSSHVSYYAGRPALALLDIDTKGMPAAVRARTDDIGGIWAALVSILPALATAGRITRRSTSAGLSRADTGEVMPGSNNMHVYVEVQDGADVERFLRTLHDRCWLSGLGWHIVGTGGQLLERSVVDRMVYGAERLVFEGPPILVAPLRQDQALRRPRVHDGSAVDTRTACLPLRIIETAQLKDMKSRSAQMLASERAAAREYFIAEQSARLAERLDITAPEARRIAARQCEGVLLPDVILPFDDETLAGRTVADVLADPARFVGATLADPLEGPDYGRTKAKIMRRADGSVWINSFAHGRTTYELRYDARAATATVQNAAKNQVADTFVKVALASDLDADELETLRNLTASLAGVGKRALDSKLKAVRDKHEADAQREARDRKVAERQDPRPQIPAPAEDAPWLPQMQVLNDVLGRSEAAEPPMRDIDGVVTQVRIRRVPNMHALTAQGANEGESRETQQPATEQPLLTRLNETHLAELIEHHIDYVDGTGKCVHLAASFVKHFHTRDDDALPIVTAVATLPLVLPNGAILAERGLDRLRGIVFRVPPDVMALLPAPEECAPDAVAADMRFLTDEWLVDVAADYAGKCTLLAAALTIIERSLLPERPAWFVTASRRGGGKTTVLIMLLMAVTGIRPAAAAWSSNEEERRKSLLAYLMEALPAIIWDNIPRGTQISCPHIEKSCTAAFYSDRRLGVSEMVAVSAAAVHLFTGNNIGPRGDLASRSLQVRLQVDRPDPENREFTNPDPIGWTEANRGRILRALYIVLLGNPALRPGLTVAPQTRFKGWWILIGSAVEHAARCAGQDINFKDLFLKQEDEDEDTSSLADMLKAMAAKWPNARAFSAAEAARVINDQSEFASTIDKECGASMREFLFPATPPNHQITPRSLGKRLKSRVGEPVSCVRATLILETTIDPHSKVATFLVQQK